MRISAFKIENGHRMFEVEDVEGDSEEEEDMPEEGRRSQPERSWVDATQMDAFVYGPVYAFKYSGKGDLETDPILKNYRLLSRKDGGWFLPVVLVRSIGSRPLELIFEQFQEAHSQEEPSQSRFWEDKSVWVEFVGTDLV